MFILVEIASKWFLEKVNFVGISLGRKTREGKQGFMYLAVIAVKPLDDYKLSLTFENKEKRIFDVSPYLKIGMFKELSDISLFKSVKVKFDTIEWANQLDIDPEFLYEKSTKEN